MAPLLSFVAIRCGDQVFLWRRSMRRFFCSLVAKTSQQASVGKSVYVYAALRGGLIIEKTVVRYCGYCCPWIRVRNDHVDRIGRADVVARPKIGRRLGESIEPVTPMCIFG